ncbi:Dehydrodolichyl diphosphate synthase [Nosema granulosis]|uniref:Dehydrodolichyl diphosphate synthase n=1 Tax=Nosema granulosis TaxID=83296 RepID=A0A9P6KZK3_9MICR|nr:Dehydrodolichyl diphosphate synthase [Nosema granulosis]
MNVHTKSKIIVVEILECIINDRRVISVFNMLSEIIKLVLGMSIKIETKRRNSILIALLIISKVAIVLNNLLGITKIFIGFEFKGLKNYSIWIALVYLFSEFTKKKIYKPIYSTCIISSLIFLTPEKILWCTAFLFIKPEYFLLITAFSSIFDHLFIFISLLLLLRLFRCKFFNTLKIAFIADGNRRYLKNNNLSEESVKSQGICKIYEIAMLCSKLGVKEVGFYCFSIKNFSRPKSEIKNIMSVISDGKYKYKAENLNIKFKVYGRLNLLQKDVQNELVDLIASTRNNKDITVNLFIAYSTTDELENGIVFDGDVDLLVRTSGEKRLSDFLVRQCSTGTHIFFASPLWPELTIVHCILILIKYKLEIKFFKNK